ncbi:hypothetical protein SKAU_G00346250 [Synaphobranchus kaupii]|uniref:Uncharacterized protein n=1 Tax=Synaphobranchus kaupii TaxID=118154 RepID=A0A9Q1IHI4_SYNKA|nr:hypothetical protein SKAU_G00346250 [Synaphobranchus kaupii]
MEQEAPHAGTQQDRGAGEHLSCHLAVRWHEICAEGLRQQRHCRGSGTSVWDSQGYTGRFVQDGSRVRLHPIILPLLLLRPLEALKVKERTVHPTTNERDRT